MTRYAAPLLLPIVLSMMLFYMLDPVRRSPRAVACSAIPRIAGRRLRPGHRGHRGRRVAVAADRFGADEGAQGAAHLRQTLRENRKVQATPPLERIQQAARAVDTAAAEATKSPPRSATRA
jgi:hypothetical protein